ncbi:tRNA (N6-threonylcarbamoyladenosine(37)-N6)-methyltransferase TrmO [Aureimonas sp. SA4125]|uniref:SAM-dependent methyltransferase n=1 Tax=Aureimonas sp. SA4125 TaxID=2826993 RepID=UPI001CC694D0|nr:SAM-dependent methyltransferase [Aureimonas sp. SA4125]BDA85615.1 tRNA (N6-threonylcarbamoyladenosine(37)-N6)-methyltransferase TrmO [Aureimonas sp. SA4125]
MEKSDTIRPGEQTLAIDPATLADAQLAFIGQIASPWSRREDCPKNMREARLRARPAAILIAAPFRPALAGLAAGQFLHVLTWLGQARRDLALQMPRHASQPRGTFALRSPVRPNPIGLHLVRILAIDSAEGRIDIDGIDVLDATAVVDLKPFFETADIPPAGPFFGGSPGGEDA